MTDYEIRLLKADGTLSIIMAITALGDVDAKVQAIAMLKDGITRAELWRGTDMIGIITLPPDPKL
jgi:hypothetical protein